MEYCIVEGALYIVSVFSPHKGTMFILFHAEIGLSDRH